MRLSHAVTFPSCQLSSRLQGFHSFAATYPFKGLSLSQLSSECRSREMNGFVERVSFQDFLQKQDRPHNQPASPALTTAPGPHRLPGQHPTCPSSTLSGSGRRFDSVQHSLHNGLLLVSSQEKDVKFGGHSAHEQLVIVNSPRKLPLKPHDFSTLNNRRVVKALIETIHPGVLVTAAVITVLCDVVLLLLNPYHSLEEVNVIILIL